MDVVEVKNLVKRYGSTLALDHFNMEIKQGEVFGLLGPNGSGKTTAINCILQLLTYDKGEIKLFDEPMSPTRYDLKKRIGIVPQNVAVFEELNVRENINYFCGLYVSDAKRRKECVDDAIEFTGLQDYTKFRPRKLSGGLLRRLNIACGIAHKPELAFFDEPTVAVDPQSRASILQGILDMNKAGTTVVYTSHYMEEVEEICSRIMIMDKGRTLAIGTNTQLKVMTGIGERIEMDIVDLPEAARAKVQGLECVQRAEYEGKTLRIVCNSGQHNVADILECLTAFGAHPGRIWAEPPTLNDVFLEITGRDLRD
ncbi:ABC transporter ATP-binding protein [Adlercreutzia sp. ZJ154]|uniref:ABC transporter ATP-binding protein n=1 Tax=Adlercreutzia sp. ZJ154 TaxID=2709790 RepID=UPI001F152BEF|nr:ABC transporter ATP-binding protein [Adlercreutzia sp. ZJ154]